MRKKIAEILTITSGLFILVLSATALVPTQTVFAAAATAPTDPKTAICAGVGLAGGGSTDCSDSKTGPSVNSIVKLIINVLSLIVGLAAVIMIIIGGLKYITSQGEASNTAGAKNTILYAIIGLVVVALAQIIVKFVLSRVK